MRANKMVFPVLAWMASAIGAAATQTADLAGRWEVTTTYQGGDYVAGLNLTAGPEGYQGRSGYLVPDGTFPYHYAGALRADGLHLTVLTPRTATPIGELLLVPNAKGLSGKGTLQGVPVTLTARRPLVTPPTPRSLSLVPTVYYRTLSGEHPPALHVFPGDSVSTTTLDAGGGDQRARPAALPGNPQTGPFFIEGAMPGDTIAVHFTRIAPNRTTAFQYRAALNPGVLPPGSALHPTPDWSDIWNLDAASHTGRPEKPSDKLKNLQVHLLPMLGCVGVAPYWNQAFTTSDLGPFGGNLDYNQIREGTTVYLPVYQAGALLFMGDGHAFQEDGEITGQGFETSMNVEFTVTLLKDQLLNQPWFENADYIMVSGVSGSLNSALQVATAGLANWLKAYYQLDDSEVATVLGVGMQYDIAEVVDPEVHIVAKIKKSVLGQIPKPPPAAAFFCQAGSGCLVE